MPHFVHIDIAADDPQRAADFYADVFDWPVTKLEGPTPYWLLGTGQDGAGIGGGIARRERRWQTMTPTIEVPSAEAYGKKITACGGTIVVPATEIAGVGQLVTCRDPEGNVFAILQPAPGNPFVPPPSGGKPPA
ncbi:VOC family protein [Devosia sp. PTR5]|uniref:VOC family protein n=1 Tax=Devosia oryzisoli TaxID=2774138 RepID=A0A927FZN3_9HYPH|nr:VOC family protein [Devosia oryzisoli]MBD8067026.1 VOC family protein [Devosia oryzisoli]